MAQTKTNRARHTITRAVTTVNQCRNDIRCDHGDRTDGYLIRIAGLLKQAKREQVEAERLLLLADQLATCVGQEIEAGAPSGDEKEHPVIASHSKILNAYTAARKTQLEAKE